MSQSSPIQCHVFEGLCNRINCLASALATGRPVSLRWAVNRQCPLEFEAIFDAISDVTVVNETVDQYGYEASPRCVGWYFPRNVDVLAPDVFRERLFGAYRLLLSRLIQREHVIPPTPAIGLVYRHFHPHGDTFDHFWQSVAPVVSNLRPRSVFVASDSDEHKRLLLRRLDDLGAVTAANDCPLLASDLARSAGNVLGMCRDLLSLGYCREAVIASSSVSTVPDSLRGLGIHVYYTHRSPDFRFHGDDDAFHFHGIDELVIGGRFKTGTGTLP
jgi:hypothetical protein